MSEFQADKLAHEKNDPTERSSLKFVNVPLTLLAVFFGFGITFLALRTHEVSMKEGDSRTHADPSAPAAPGAGGSDLAALLERGKQIYTTTCQACHQANGLGLAGAFPPLAGSEWITGPQKRMAAIVLHGIDGEITVKGEKFKNVMPTFKEQLKSDEIAAVATYVRRTFGKSDDTLTAELVDSVREQTKSRTAPWAGEAELNQQKWE